MLEARVVSTIADIGRGAWNACFPATLETFDYLAAIEKAGLEGFRWRYVAVLDGGEVIAAAPGFIAEYHLDTTLTGVGKRLAQRVHTLLPGALTLRLGCIGSPCTETASIGFRPDVALDRRAGLLNRLTEAFMQAARREGCALQAIKDVATPQKALCDEVLTPLGYRTIAGLPVAHLDIDFPSLEAYFARMSAGTRKDMRRKLRALDTIRVEHRRDIADVMERVLALYRDTRSRAEMQFEDLTPDYFRGVLEEMGERAFCTLYFAGDELLAANLLLRDGQTLLDKFFCMDGERGRDFNLYFLSWFSNVRYCLEHGLKRYQSGQAAYANKLRLGSKLTRTSMYFRHRNALFNHALRFVAPMFAADPTAHFENVEAA